MAHMDKIIRKLIEILSFPALIFLILAGICGIIILVVMSAEAFGFSNELWHIIRGISFFGIGYFIADKYK